MNQTVKYLLLMIAIVTSPALCQATEINIDSKQCGTNQALKAGDILTLSLSANPTTGYAWQVVQIPAQLNITGEAAYHPDSSMIGSGGTTIYRFGIIATGKGKLSLVYKRPWEKNQAPVKNCDITIVVSAQTDNN